jgi:hypothetical protein
VYAGLAIVLTFFEFSQVYRRCIAGVSHVYRRCVSGVSQVCLRCTATLSQVDTNLKLRTQLDLDASAPLVWPVV